MSNNKHIKAPKNQKYKLFNIFSGEIHELIFDEIILKKIIKILLDNKTNDNMKISDEQFIIEANNIKKNSGVTIYKIDN